MAASRTEKRSESPTTRRAGGLDFSAVSGKRQRHDSALIGAGVTVCKARGLKTPNKNLKINTNSYNNGASEVKS
jgi:hypothetical protein